MKLRGASLLMDNLPRRRWGRDGARVLGAFTQALFLALRIFPVSEMEHSFGARPGFTNRRRVQHPVNPMRVLLRPLPTDANSDAKDDKYIIYQLFKKWEAGGYVLVQARRRDGGCGLADELPELRRRRRKATGPCPAARWRQAASRRVPQGATTMLS